MIEEKTRLKPFKGLKLEQTIYAESTSYSDDEIIKIVKTTLKDAVINKGKLKLVLGAGEWGACPTRTKDKAITNVDQIRDFILRKISEEREMKADFDDCLKDGHIKLHLNNFNGYHTVSVLKHSDTFNSLKDGKYWVYRGSNRIVRIYEDRSKPKNIFGDVESLIKEFETNLKEYF